MVFTLNLMAVHARVGCARASRRSVIMLRSLAPLVLAGALGSLASSDVPRASEQHIDIYKSSQLPELYQIDDYDRCLSQPGALYCVGTFRLTADRQAPSYRYYRMIEEYSSEPRHFNRTLLHRGYCLSSRCPNLSNGTREQWFSSCAQTQEQSLALQLELHTYRCKSPTDQNLVIEERDMIFAWAIAALLALNVLGTLYDVNNGNVTKSKILTAWSVRSNWQSLKNTIHDHGDPRVQGLVSIEGFRVLLHALFIAGHVMGVYNQLYLKNPEHIEQLYYETSSFFWRNGACVVHGLVMLSSFLYTNNRIACSKKNPSISQLPKAVLRRIVRLMPVHMLVVGFAATWWRYTGDGPLWSSLVTQESNVCRRKLPLHALFLHNLVDNDEHCLVQTWSFAVDVQLFFVSYLLMVMLEMLKLKPIPVLSGLYFFFAFLNGLLAYMNEWESLVYIADPEGIRGSFKGLKSFSDFYISPLHNVPAYLLGIILAYVHNHMREQGIKLDSSKLYIWFYHMGIPLMVSWVIGGQWFYERRSPLTTAVYAAIEKPFFLLILSVYFMGIINDLDDVVRRLTLWRGWRPLGRISMSMMTVHWCVIKTLLASRRTLADFNSYNVAIDTFTTCFFSYCLALPLTLLVEMPFMKTFTAMLD